MGYVMSRTGRSGKKRHTAIFRDVTGRPRSAGTFDSYDTALRKAHIAQENAERGISGDVRRGRVRLRDYVETEWIRNHQVEDTTRESYVYTLNRYVLPELGDLRLRDIDSERVRAWVTRLSTVYGANPPTIRYAKIVLDAILTTLVNDRILPYHPGRAVRTPPVVRKPQQVITVEDFQRLHDALESETMRLLVETDIETGLRWGELTELRPKDINFRTGILTVSRTVVRLHSHTATTAPGFKVKSYPKDREHRQLKLAAHLLEKLAAHIAANGIDREDLIFTTPLPTGPARRRRPAVLPDPATLGTTAPNEKGRVYQHGTKTAYQAAPCRCTYCKDAMAAYRAERRAQGKDSPRAQREPAVDAERHLLNAWFRNNVWDKALEEAKLDYHVSPHGLRHAHASWLLAGGANLQVVKERLGHGSIATTEKYLHALPSRHDEALTALDNIRGVMAPTSTPMSPARPEVDAPRPVPSDAAAAGVDLSQVIANLDPQTARNLLAGLLTHGQAANAN